MVTLCVDCVVECDWSFLWIVFLVGGGVNDLLLLVACASPGVLGLILLILDVVFCP